MHDFMKVFAKYEITGMEYHLISNHVKYLIKNISKCDFENVSV